MDGSVDAGGMEKVDHFVQVHEAAASRHLVSYFRASLSGLCRQGPTSGADSGTIRCP